MPQPTSAQLGAAIRQLRGSDSRHLSIEDLAAEADVHWVTVSRIENGKLNPTWDLIAKLAEGLGVEMAELARVAAEQSP